MLAPRKLSVVAVGLAGAAFFLYRRRQSDGKST